MLGIGLKTTALSRIYSKNFGIGRFYENSFRNGGLHLQRKNQYIFIMDKSLGGMITMLAICYIIEELIFIIIVSLIGAILAGYGIYRLIKYIYIARIKKIGK